MSYIFYITCDKQVLCDRLVRKYHLEPCSSISHLECIAMNSTLCLVEFYLVYSDEFTLGGVSGPYVLDEFGELYEEIDECENIFAREKHSEAKVGEYTGPSWFLGRNKFVFSSCEASGEGCGLIETFELVRANTGYDALCEFDNSGATKEDINYFDVDFPFHGQTYFCGVKSVLPVCDDWAQRGFCISETLDLSEENLMRNITLTKKERQETLGSILKVVRNRAAHGNLDFNSNVRNA